MHIYAEKEGLTFDENSFPLEALFKKEVSIIIPALAVRAEKEKGKIDQGVHLQQPVL